VQQLPVLTLRDKLHDDKNNDVDIANAIYMWHPFLFIPHMTPFELTTPELNVLGT